LTELDTDCTQPRSSIPVRLSPGKTSLYTISIIRTKNDFQENVEEGANSQQGQRDKKTGEETSIGSPWRSNPAAIENPTVRSSVIAAQIRIKKRPILV